MPLILASSSSIMPAWSATKSFWVSWTISCPLQGNDLECRATSPVWQPLQDDGGASTRILDLPELLPSHIQESDATSILDALLRHCLEGRQYQADELFHFCVLKWMMQSGLPPYRYKSPYLKNFLQVHAKDDPEILCRYLPAQRTMGRSM